MTCNFNRCVLIALIGAFTIPAFAQLNNTVEVTNEVRPVVKDANKINILPSVVETPVKHHEVQYSNEVAPATEFASTPLGNYSSQAVQDGLRNGFVTLGGGTQGRANGQFDYRLAIGKNNALVLDFMLDGFNGRNRQDGLYSSSERCIRKYDSQAGLAFDHWFSNGAKLQLKGGYGNQVFNYLGAHSTTDGNRQHATLGSFEASVNSWKMNRFELELNAGVDFFSHKYAILTPDNYSETAMHFDADAAYEINEFNSVELGVKAFHSAYTMDEVEGITTLFFSPRYVFSNERILFKAGLLAGINGDIAPELQFFFHVNNHTDWYVKTIGYDKENNMRRLSALSPHFQFAGIGAPMEVESEFHQINASAGYRFTHKTFSGDINIGYDVANNVAEIYHMATAANGNWYPLINFHKTRCFYVNADFAYGYKDIVKAEFKNRFNAMQIKDEEQWKPGSYTQPMVDVHWKADAKIVKGLHAGLSYDLAYYYNPQMDESDGYKRPLTSNLAATLRYAIPVKMPLSVYVKGDNLLNHKHDIFYGYRAIGTTVMGGIALSF